MTAECGSIPGGGSGNALTVIRPEREATPQLPQCTPDMHKYNFFHHINPLAPELFFLILAHPVYKM
jgi:hypothetical protein